MKNRMEELSESVGERAESDRAVRVTDCHVFNGIRAGLIEGGAGWELSAMRMDSSWTEFQEGIREMEVVYAYPAISQGTRAFL